MYEHVLASALRLNEAVSLSCVEPLHGTGCHYTLHCSHYGPNIIRQSAATGYGSKYKNPRPESDCSRDRDTTRRAFARRSRACCLKSRRLRFALGVSAGRQSEGAFLG